MNTAFERRLNSLVLLGHDWRTNEIFTAEAKQLTKDLCLTASMNADILDLSECLGGLQGVLASQEKWLQGQLNAALDNAEYHVNVKWVLQSPGGMKC